MNDDMKRIGDAARIFKGAPHDGDAFHRVSVAVLLELRQMSDRMATAMMSVEWPEGMSVVDQMRAMHEAMIDAVIKE